MGGSIRVVIKLDGTMHKQIRMTNYLPNFVPYPEFINVDKEYVQAYINRGSPEDQVEKQTISPYDYGLDVFDFDAKKLWTMQNYCSYIDIDTILLSMWYNGRMIGEGGNPIDETNPDYYPTYIKSMWDAGHIKVRGYTGTKEELWDSAKEYFLTKDQVKLSMEECYLIMSKNWDVEHRKQNISQYFEDLWNKLIAKNPVQPQLLNFVIDWEAAGWTINDYENTPAGAKLFMQAIDGMLSDEDTKDWEEWISERSE
jgi:hypothetical protein